jgi:hypothetical protein
MAQTAVLDRQSHGMGDRISCSSDRRGSLVLAGLVCATGPTDGANCAIPGIAATVVDLIELDGRDLRREPIEAHMGWTIGR